MCLFIYLFMYLCIYFFSYLSIHICICMGIPLKKCEREWDLLTRDWYKVFATSSVGWSNFHSM